MTKHTEYMPGFNNHFATEAIANTLPKGQNSPQQVAHGLYAEQLSGSAFTAPRSSNLRSWLYRIRPSVMHSKFSAYTSNGWLKNTQSVEDTPPNQMRWDPLPIPKEKTDFISGLHYFADHGSVGSFAGAAIHLYAINQSMTDTFFYNADGELLFVPQTGGLLLRTEFGLIDLTPGEIAVIPRGVKFQVILKDKQARGYICENYSEPLHLPDLGPIGANGLANPRDFLTPVAFFEEKTGDYQLICKFQNNLWQASMQHSPLDVVAWHGNFAPYKYNLKHFNTINTVSFDHPDPSIFTVLTSQTNTPGVANLDFVIFPERWMVADNTFRPPYFHRNIMSEFMGLIHGEYDAKETGFVPGGSSLHNCMSAHGPDKQAFESASNIELAPERYEGTLAFMFESCNVWRPSQFALQTPLKQMDYQQCWADLPVNFKAP